MGNRGLAILVHLVMHLVLYFSLSSQLAITAMGAVGGPSVGVMFLGATFPQANWIVGNFLNFYACHTQHTFLV